MSLTLQDLTVRRDGCPTVDHVTLSIPAGSFVGLIGPNGAGKTTLMQAALGLIPAEGQSDLAALPPARRARRAAWLPQAREIAWPIPVEALVRLGRRADPDRRADTQAVAGAMAALDVTHLAQRRATELSGGELARALIARLLAQRTPLILADEPVAGLDPAHQFAVMELFARLARQGRTVIASIHDLALAARYCQRLVLMDRGRVVADGTPTEVLSPARLTAAFGVSGAFVPTPSGPVFVTLPPPPRSAAPVPPEP
ncbi:ABC transporter ATP-binding protein [Paracoccus sp. (in: a-proteobacteria)]|uniref:ABC transporter ATP-binding protein n=1 Tax=Paracoccus sp. TaxID=267 RepID=UPI0026E0CE9F|nr:ABC transporter ATP-binding protein [Paracoccus sp. (in: a-proteobacteria)]MDO5370722.1 ABC transporter ATP-binding protein [Paracoccus sp. (in: a-proteobacteria)]